MAKTFHSSSVDCTQFFIAAGYLYECYRPQQHPKCGHCHRQAADKSSLTRRGTTQDDPPDGDQISHIRERENTMGHGVVPIDEPALARIQLQPKASKLLGVDRSQLKVMDRLGLDPQQLLTAREEQLDHSEALTRREREQQAWQLHRPCAKARAMLGFNPSDRKAMDILGIDDSALQRAKRLHSLLEYTRSRPLDSLPAGLDRKRLRKAFQWLGIAPSQRKVMDRLGLDDSDLRRLQKEEDQRYLEFCEQERRTERYIHRKDAQKAFRRLGEDPVVHKLKHHLGVEKAQIERQVYVQMGLPLCDNELKAEQR
ncbi:hypothetical protein PROFUN_06287 [Planoprotostelium fungivorum]|uniref:Uncharacterized protein n=1 Tax=Planoprotostelium fungivorum TaxID=1890364 RepID=A0A2P6NEC4_9EUKA|nr:hypothetical protein PROFUN_06287 [Planoprotostelium fungivorum]